MRNLFSKLFPRGQDALPWAVSVLAALLLLAIWLEAGLRMREQEVQAMHSARSEASNIATTIAANLDEILARTAIYARVAQDLLDGHGGDAGQLGAAIASDGAILNAAVFTHDGRLTYSSSQRGQEPELRQLALEALRKPSTPGELFIGSHAASEARMSWRIPVAIALHSGSGVFAAFMDLGYFLQVYRGLDLGSGGRLEILDLEGNGLVQLRNGMLAGGELQSRGAPAASESDCALPELACAGTLLTLDRLPLKIAVLRERAAVVAALEHSRRVQILRGILGSVLILGAALAIIAVLSRKQRLYGQLEHAQLQKQVLIEQLQQERNRAFQLASLDYLTGIPNRMEFVARAERELARARRSRNLVAMYFLDLDRFKPVNDTLGHNVGDKLLKAVAERLCSAVREYDLVGRFGGDEFVVLVSELQDEAQVATIADKLLEAICTPFCGIEGHDIEIGTSVGVALAPRDGRDIQSLLAAADCAMYAAKSAGRGHFRFYDPALNNSTARDYELVARLKRAIADGELQLHYQSRVRLADFSVAGLEALVRWQHPEHGLIYPGEFIPLAEAHDLIVPLGEWVIWQACRQLRAWLDEGVPAVPVAINISARQLNGTGLADCVRQALAGHQLSPQMLEIEVTESCFFDPDGPGLRELRQLEQLGMKISLDDYGTGFSSLNQLKRLPVNTIKIDRSFIKDIRNDANDMLIVGSTIILAHNLGLSVVAEGVETSEQLVHLKTAGCDEVQGFYFHRPAQAQEVPAILARSPLMRVVA